MSTKINKRRRPEFRKISKESLKEAYEKFATDYPCPVDRSQMMSNSLIAHYLGGEWLDMHLNSKSREARYLRVDINDPFREQSKALSKVWEFSETLLNLQHVDGFERVLDELAFGKIESACAEIDIARMFLFRELKFRFVQPQQVAKLDYDFEIFYPDGLKVRNSTLLDLTESLDSSRLCAANGVRDEYPGNLSVLSDARASRRAP
jgi:hypothetical protein